MRCVYQLPERENVHALAHRALQHAAASDRSSVQKLFLRYSPHSTISCSETTTTPEVIDIIRAGSLNGFCQLARLQGAEPTSLLAEVGLNEGDLDDPDNYLRRADVVDLLEVTAKKLACPDFGLRLAEVQDINILGALAFVIRNAETLRDGFTMASKYVHYHASSGGILLEAGEGPFEERLCFAMDHDYGEATAQMAEHTVGVLCRVTRHLTGGEVEPRRIVFPHSRISRQSIYEEYLHVRPDFESRPFSVTFTRSDLDFPLKSANRPLQAIVEQYLQAHLPPLSPHIEMRTHQVTSRLMRATGRVAINDIAEMLRMHPRTLQRSLKANGTTFELVRDNVRRSLAEIYLANEAIPIAHVADLIGYSNQSALTRSCLRWFGKTPLAVRVEFCGRSMRAQTDRGARHAPHDHAS
jgi:AraC-like DNA-binding protein